MLGTLVNKAEEDWARVPSSDKVESFALLGLLDL
jgi:hypothetical protein